MKVICTSPSFARYDAAPIDTLRQQEGALFGAASEEQGGSRQSQMVLVTFPAVAGKPAEQVWLVTRSYAPNDPGYMKLS